MAYDDPAGKSGYREPGQKDLNGNPSKANICTFLKATALQFLQIVYGQKPIGHLHYSDDDDATEIKIVDQYAYQLNADEKSPAIIAVRGPVSFSNIGLNRGMTEMKMRTGVVTRTDLINGSVGLACTSRVGLEAEQIASDVFNLFKHFNNVLQEAGFFTIHAMDLGTEQMVSAVGEPKMFMVNVTLRCQIQDRWVLTNSATAELRQLIIEGLQDLK